MAARIDLPPLVEPQLATLVKAPPNGDEWLHELKYDGYRIVARLDRGDVRLRSRRNLDWSSRFPTVRAAVAKLRADVAVLDGEVAAVLPDGRTTFQGLQNALDGGGTYPVVYFVFDLLHVDGEDLLALPLEERKQRLHQLLERSRAPEALRYSDHIVGNGPAFFEAIRQLGRIEGMVSKRRTSHYRPGRSNDWVKTKCMQRRLVVVCGFTDPEGSRSSLGALLLGCFDGDRLAYAGRVGSGFSEQEAAVLRAHLEMIEVPAPPYWLARRGGSPGTIPIGSSPVSSPRSSSSSRRTTARSAMGPSRASEQVFARWRLIAPADRCPAAYRTHCPGVSAHRTSRASSCVVVYGTTLARSAGTQTSPLLVALWFGRVPRRGPPHSVHRRTRGARARADPPRAAGGQGVGQSGVLVAPGWPGGWRENEPAQRTLHRRAVRPMIGAGTPSRAGTGRVRVRLAEADRRRARVGTRSRPGGRGGARRPVSASVSRVASKKRVGSSPPSTGAWGERVMC